MFVTVTGGGCVQLITYEMACTVNALKFFFSFGLDEGKHFCTFNTVSDVPIKHVVFGSAICK